MTATPKSAAAAGEDRERHLKTKATELIVPVEAGSYFQPFRDSMTACTSKGCPRASILLIVPFGAIKRSALTVPVMFNLFASVG